MYQECIRHFPACNIAIMSAAVADFRPIKTATQKIKKNTASLTLTLEPTEDILRTMGENKKPHQVLVGFALETDNEQVNAREKLHNKNLDLIVLNSLRDKGAGFGYGTNKITLIDKDNQSLSFDIKPKQEVAKDIFDWLIQKNLKK